MSFHVELKLQDLDVLIVGGGHVALRKAKQCCREGARVHVVANKCCEELKALNVMLCTAPYHEDMLEHVSLCFVCSDDVAFNTRVLQDGRAHHCLCMGVGLRDQDATLYPMVSKEYECFQLAISTKGNFPARSSQLVDIAGTYLQKQEGSRLKVQSMLRKEAKHHFDYDMRVPFIHYLEKASDYMLHQCEGIVTHSTIHVLCYHGVRFLDVQQDIQDFEKEVQAHVTDAMVISVFLSNTLCGVWNTHEIRVFSFDQIMPYISILPKNIILHPMLFQTGRFLNQIKRYDSVCQIRPLPFGTPQAVGVLLDALQTYHHDDTHLIVRYHCNREGSFVKLLSQCSYDRSNTHVLHEKEVMDLSSLPTNDITIIVLYMLSGVHSREEQKRIEHYRTQGFHITYIEQSAIRNPIMKALLLQHILL